MTTEADWVAVDWGTSNLRAWGIGPRGDVVFSRMSDQGMSRLTPDAYPRVLGGLLAGDFAPTGPRIDVLICGMAGARQGWMEAPYLETPADLAALAAAAVAPAMPEARLSPRILPGVCQRLPPHTEPREDVADHGRQREPMAGKAGRDEQPVGPGDGTEHRQPVGREGFDARPAFGDDAAGQGRVDGARHLQAAAGAILLHLPAVRGLVEDERGPAAADEIGAVGELLQAESARKATQHRREAGRRGIGEQHLERARLQRNPHAQEPETVVVLDGAQAARRLLGI